MDGGLVAAIRSVVYRVGVLLSAAGLGAFFGFFVFGLGLFVPAPVARPLAYLTTGVFAALGATWSANALAPDRSRTRLLPVVAVSLAAAAVISAGDVVLILTVASEGPAAATVLLGWLALALAASSAAWSLREPDRRLRRDALITLGVFVAAILFVVGSVAVTCSLTPCIP